MAKVKHIKTPFNCHICDWAYVDICRTIDERYYCKCRKCKRQTKIYDNPFDAHKAFKE